MSSSESILKIENSKVPWGGYLPPKTYVGWKEKCPAKCKARQVCGMFVKNKDIPRHYIPIAAMATRCCHCSLNYPEFWHSPDVVLNLEGLKS